MNVTTDCRKNVGIQSLLDGQDVRRVSVEGQNWYAAVDVVRLLGDQTEPRELWEQLKLREPPLAHRALQMEFPAVPGRPEASEGLDVEGVFRLVQAIPSPRAERLKSWLARSARQRLEEAENPELLALRARNLYERRGYPRRWVDKRLRGMSARHELTAEWYKRGVSDSEQYRNLTNRLMHSAFGMDVEEYRRYKKLAGTRQPLRDHMSDLELALTSLGETTAVALHQARQSQGLEQLDADAKDAGEIVAQTLAQIERRSGRPVLQPSGNHTGARPRRRHPGQEVASEARSDQNPSPAGATRTVA